jgi:hypothetical protein
MKYPPVVFINDTPCGFVRHLECRNLDVSKKLWGERAGCFEKPQIGIKPSEVRFTLATMRFLIG